MARSGRTVAEAGGAKAEEIVMKSSPMIDRRKARLYFTYGRIEHFRNQQLAYAIWLALPKGVRVAFRGANDTRSVYDWDCVDAP
jgi:hypothetical protein